MKTVKTIQQLLDGKSIHEFQNRGSLRTVRMLLKLGFTPDYVPTYNVLMFGEHIIGMFEFDLLSTQQDLFAGSAAEIAQKDFIWLCNYISKVISRKRELNDGFRVCRGIDWSLTYKHKRGWSVAGREVKLIDKPITNPVTNSVFTIGWTVGDYD